MPAFLEKGMKLSVFVFAVDAVNLKIKGQIERQQAIYQRSKITVI